MVDLILIISHTSCSHSALIEGRIVSLPLLSYNRFHRVIASSFKRQVSQARKHTKRDCGVAVIRAKIDREAS